jgi:hypothetical protein
MLAPALWHFVADLCGRPSFAWRDERLESLRFELFKIRLAPMVGLGEIKMLVLVTRLPP